MWVAMLYSCEVLLCVCVPVYLVQASRSGLTPLATARDVIFLLVLYFILIITSQRRLVLFWFGGCI
jgi:hypothetical protein